MLEIGCGPGVAAREIARRIGPGFVLGIDRSPRAIAQAERGSADLIAQGRLAFREAAAEDFARLPGESPFDLAVALRVGALDGRHPQAGARALARIAAALVPGGALYVDTGAPLTRIPLTR